MLFSCFCFSWALLGLANSEVSVSIVSLDSNHATIDECTSSGNCLPICCPTGLYLRGVSCVENGKAPASDLDLPQFYNDDLEPVYNWNYSKFYRGPCTTGSYALDPDAIPEDEYYLLKNGTVLLAQGKILGHEDYCFASIPGTNGSYTAIAVCFENAYDPNAERNPLFYPIAMLLSAPFMIATFVVYTVIPEFNTIHGTTLRAYIAALFVGYMGLVVVHIGHHSLIEVEVLCTTLAFTIHFSFLASFFWLNVMCFDIWWTFGGFRSLQGSIKQRERKKFLMYSIYAWGCAAILTAVCLIMDFVPGIPDGILKPEFGVESCWFKTEEAKALYFYGPMGITVLCNIGLFISTAAKIIQHKKDTAHHLKGMDSKRHDDNKQWFNLYLKLFIVMGINWSMEIISWLCQGPKSLWYLTDIANSLQGVIIFIIFVWKQKIKRLLMKRFGCQGTNFLSRDSTRSAYHSSSSRTCTTSIPLHEKTNQFPDPVSRATKNVSDDSDGA